MLPAEPAQHHVVILGASPKAIRYANMAQHLLMAKGYQITPVHPMLSEIDGLAVVNKLADVPQPVHTLTLYVGSARLEEMVGEILQLRPQRVIFNPGTETQTLQQALEAQGCECVTGCTLVMLKTKVF